jgi:hypothetical protein
MPPCQLSLLLSQQHLQLLLDLLVLPLPPLLLGLQLAQLLLKASALLRPLLLQQQQLLLLRCSLGNRCIWLLLLWRRVWLAQWLVLLLLLALALLVLPFRGAAALWLAASRRRASAYGI